MRSLLPCLAFLLLARAAHGYVEARYTLARIIKDSTNIVVLKVDKVNKERKLIYFKKVADLKGTHPDMDVRHNVGVGGFNAQEQKIPIEWAEVGKIAIFFHNGTASETCLGKYWYQTYPGGAWWNHSHGEPFLARSYCGDIEALRAAVEKILKGEEVVVPTTVSKTDLRIQKVKTSLAKVDDYRVVEPPTIEKTPLTNVAGFSEMIELPRPEGRIQGAIPVDIDGDGHLDLLLVGHAGMRLLRNNQKGNFDDVTDKWGLSDAPGTLAAAFADYDGSGRLSLFTSLGRLYTNVGGSFRDDTAKLPATPKRVRNPGEAFGWLDLDGDGRPDLVNSVGVRGLTAWRNTGDAKSPFEDVSAKVGLGDEGLAQEPANYLTTTDLDGDGRPDFLLNLTQPFVALNRQGVFQDGTASAGLAFPCLGRPATAFADFRNSGKLGVFVTAHDRIGAVADWHMIGTFSEEEDKKLAAGPDFSPTKNPKVEIGKDTWNWDNVQADAGVLEIRRRSPSPNACYAHGVFEWPTAEKIALHVGSLNGVTVWLNGKQVYEHKEKRPFLADQDRIEVEAKKGANTLLLKVMDEGPQWKTSVRPAKLSVYPPPSVKLYESDGKGKFTDVTLDAGDLAQLRTEAVSAVWGDLDNNGHLDLVVTTATGLVRVYLNQGDGKFHYATAELGLEQKFKAQGVVLADFNNDGRLDMVLLGEDADPVALLVSKIPAKRTPLTVRFAGPESTINATVRLKDESGKLLATRYLTGGDGRSMQAAPEAHFAATPGKVRVEVRYSSGQVRTKDVTVGAQPLVEKIEKTPTE